MKKITVEQSKVLKNYRIDCSVFRGHPVPPNPVRYTYSVLDLHFSRPCCALLDKTYKSNVSQQNQTEVQKIKRKLRLILIVFVQRDLCSMGVNPRVSFLFIWGGGGSIYWTIPHPPRWIETMHSRIYASVMFDRKLRLILTYVWFQVKFCATGPWDGGGVSSLSWQEKKGSSPPVGEELTRKKQQKTMHARTKHDHFLLGGGGAQGQQARY